MKLKTQSEPELHSHIVTSIVPPAGPDKTTHIEPNRYCGKKNVARVAPTHNHDVEGYHWNTFRPICFCIGGNIINEEAWTYDDRNFINICQIIFSQILEIIQPCAYVPKRRVRGLWVHHASKIRRGIQNKTNWMLRSIASALAKVFGGSGSRKKWRNM